MRILLSFAFMLTMPRWAEVATQRVDWTLGCIALTNADMDRLWQALDLPVTIEIKP